MKSCSNSSKVSTNTQNTLDMSFICAVVSVPRIGYLQKGCIKSGISLYLRTIEELS
ncbi:hypothetical protein MtrunA17_Chr1g0207961 [Medicago truncatula]|uniref:Uncharacterized protein n=1 Tax=Medicago truncatula TaxID=3880 RepID=A0A396K385_MEDTR|nr:hypothetical protein MtrunA17_Chr1g0207961 [Medicago truncatula]